jgi:hypothetical protein
MIWSKKNNQFCFFFTGRQKPNQNVLKSNSIQIPNLSPIWSYILIGEVHRVLAQPTVNILLFFLSMVLWEKNWSRDLYLHR